MNPSKLQRHLDTNHPTQKDKPIQFFEKKLASNKISQTNLVYFTTINGKATKASYLPSLRIAQVAKPHTIGETLVLPSIKDAVGVMFGEKHVKEMMRMPLLNSLVGRRIYEMAQWTEDTLIQRVSQSTFFALRLDESADVHGII